VNLIHLQYIDLAMASVLILLLAALSSRIALAIGSDLLIAAARTVVQLLLVGVVLKYLFANADLIWVALMAIVMLAVAARETWARQHRRLAGIWGVAIGAGALFVSSFSLTVLALALLVQPVPWYAPQYSIPLLGMLLGNTMSAVALALDRLHSGAFDKRSQIEAQLALGETWTTALGAVRTESIRLALLPSINAMAAAGVVSLPGMMTGQILSGTAPVEAVKYQILIMFLITGAAGIGVLSAVAVASRRLFDERERLCLDRLRVKT